MRIGINLLVRNLREHPLHARALGFAFRSLFENEHDLQAHLCHVAVIDNASTCPITMAWLNQLEARHPANVSVVRLPVNYGIAKGRNVGYKLLGEIDPDYVLEIHTDHIFPSLWLQPMLDTMEAPGNERIGILGPALLTDRVAWSVGHLHIDYTGEYQPARDLVEDAAAGLRNAGRVVPGLTHPALKRWTMLQEIGFYDEDLPGLSNWEDTEEAYRAHQSGWTSAVDFGSVVYHHYHFSRCDPGVTNHLRDYEVNGRYCMKKHGEEFNAFAARLGQWMDQAYAGVTA